MYTNCTQPHYNEVLIRRHIRDENCENYINYDKRINRKVSIQSINKEKLVNIPFLQHMVSEYHIFRAADFFLFPELQGSLLETPSHAPVTNYLKMLVLKWGRLGARG